MKNSLFKVLIANVFLQAILLGCSDPDEIEGREQRIVPSEDAMESLVESLPPGTYEGELTLGRRCRVVAKEVIHERGIDYKITMYVESFRHSPQSLLTFVLPYDFTDRSTTVIAAPQRMDFIYRLQRSNDESQMLSVYHSSGPIESVYIHDPTQAGDGLVNVDCQIHSYLSEIKDWFPY